MCVTPPKYLFSFFKKLLKQPQKSTTFWENLKRNSVKLATHFTEYQNIHKTIGHNVVPDSRSETVGSRISEISIVFHKQNKNIHLVSEQY